LSAPRQFSPQARAERVIAAARLILVAASLLAISLDPSERSPYAHITWVLTLGYTAGASVLLVVVWRAPVMRQPWQVLMHVFDLAATSLFISLTAATDSPFFAYLVFALMSAALRWDAAAMVWTAAVVLGVFSAAFFAQFALHSPSELNSFVIRATYLIILTLMLRHLSEHGAHVRDITQRLRTWQPAVSNEPEAVIRDAVRYAAEVLGAPRAAFVWEDPDEPDVRMAWWARGELSVQRESPGAFHPLVAAPYRDADFLCRDVSARQPTVVFTFRDGIETASTSMPPVHGEFIARFAIRSVLSVRCGPGRLFVVDQPQPTADDLGLVQTVAHQISSSLDQVLLLKRLEDASVVEARARVARDLHDGVLQSLTVITLRLEAIGRPLDEATRRRLEALQAVIRDEASRLRRFIQDLTSPTPRTGDDFPTLPAELDLLKHQLERDWGLRVELVTPDLARVPPDGVRDIYFIVREALINVARHAATSTARVTVAADDQRLTITVADDGRGFPFEGRYEGTELLAMKRAPKVLYERVTSLGGRLVVESRADGSRLDIELPLSERGSQ
jgi:signal transduction histidine kinase